MSVSLPPQCIELLGANCFTAEQYTKLIEILKEHMEKRFINEKQRQEKRKDEDYDEELEETLEEEVSYIGILWSLLIKARVPV